MEEFSKKLEYQKVAYERLEEHHLLDNGKQVSIFSNGLKVIVDFKQNTYEIIDQINGVNHMTPLATYPRMILSLQSSEADAITAELPVARGVVSANPDLAIVEFEDGCGFDVDTSVSIAVAKNNTELLNSIQSALDSISERLSIMEAAVSRQPAVEE
mgnify:CR=1 FL=1